MIAMNTTLPASARVAIVAAPAGALVPLEDADAGRLAGECWAMSASWDQLDDFRRDYRALLKLAGSSAYRRAFCEEALRVLDSLESEPAARLA